MSFRPLYVPPATASTVKSSSESPAVAATKPKPITASFVMIDNYLIDVTLSEDHKFESEVTEYPVESGSTVSDNIRPKPIMVTMEGLVSNTPLASMAAVRRTRPPAEAALLALGSVGAAGALRAASSGVKTSEEAYQHLLTIYERREPVTIRTSLGTFENMALESLNFPRSSGEPDGLRFTASFKQIVVVKNKRVKVAIPIAANGGGNGKGGAKAAITKPLTSSNSGQAIPVNKNNNTWFDRDINGWREMATLKQPETTFRGSARENTTSFYWRLYKGRPLVQTGTITRKQWARWLECPDLAEPSTFSSTPTPEPLTEPDYSDPYLRQLNPGPDHDLGPGGPFADIITVYPNMYKIVPTVFKRRRVLNTFVAP